MRRIGIAGLVQPDFIVNAVPNTEEDYAGIFSANWVSAWQAGTKRVNEIYRVSIPGLADIVIASGDIYPYFQQPIWTEKKFKKYIDISKYCK